MQANFKVLIKCFKALNDLGLCSLDDDAVLGELVRAVLELVQVHVEGLGLLVVVHLAQSQGVDHPPLRPSVRPSVRSSVRPFVRSWNPNLGSRLFYQISKKDWL